MNRWVVLGAGYTGARVVALARTRGDEVIATRRVAGDGVRAVDLSTPASLTGLLAAGDHVVVTAPPLDADGTGERALAEAAAQAGVARIVYLSSTAVYAPAGGAWVDEDAAATPESDAGRARLAAEAAIASAGVSTVIVRAAGIYGPDRGVLARLRAGRYRIIGAGDTMVSRIHVDDLAALIVAAATAAAPGPIYNAADDDPTTSAALADAAAAALHLPPPPRVPLDQVEPAVVAMLTADRRIDNRRAKRELGWTPRYPSWRTALADELRWC